MAIAKKAKATTFKHAGRKYVVVKAVANRQEHSTTAIKLVKRAGKAHWFVATVEHVGIKGKEVTALVRYPDFWAALLGYSEGTEAIGVILGTAEERLSDLVALTEDEQTQLAANLEVRADA